MEENKQAKRSYRRNKPVTKSKVYAIRLDIDLVDFVREQPNMSKFINELIRKEKENTQKYESKAKDYIRRNTLDLESDNRMDSTGYVQYAISEAKAYAAIAIAEEGMRQKAIEAFKFAVDGYFIIGGTDYSASRLNEFIKNLTLNIYENNKIQRQKP